ncbi:cellulase family glycosylhydrolase [Pleionea sp. CnH1-48]|uniref:cellulase family glycosylhydrolase n=1 Tax=Pleionea sp. CnH1-48 TaxID=2954494 RepID=UPI002097B911|nr:cellulase family glycosylhydrolase [Pleionea sp. CnH1-48]MCO7224737.1 hypothetical protein [Pleionea sp. CnH1-48]
MDVKLRSIRLCLLFLILSMSSLTYAQGKSFNNPINNSLHKFVAANYTDLGVNADGSMPSDQTTLVNNASADLERLKNLGVTNVRVWAFMGYDTHEYSKMSNRVNWLANLARSKGITLTVDLFDASGETTLQTLLNHNDHINNMINYVIGGNANKNYIYWSLGNEVKGHTDPLAFASYYKDKTDMMRQKGALHISFHPVPGSLEHLWNGVTREAAKQVIDASDDISVHFYAAGARANEMSVNGLEFGSTIQWINLAHERCKPAIIGEFGISNLSQRTDANVTDWLNYFRENLKVDQVSFWQFTKDEAGHVDPQCFCATNLGVGNGPHISAMNGYLGVAATHPGQSSCGSQPPGGGNINFATGRSNPVYIKAYHGQYLSSENGTQFINANRNVRADWETFYIFPNSDGTYSIQATNNLYLDVNQRSGHYLQFNNSNRQCSDCKFIIEPIGGDVYGIKPAATGKYMSSENGQSAVRANRSHLNIWEQWTIKNISGGSSNNWKTVFSNAAELVVGQVYYSNNNEFRLVMQGDGNLVLYRSNGTPVWHTSTHGNHGARCFLQSDGNLVIYSTSGQPLWHTHTYGNSGAILQMSNDGKIRIRKNNQTLWQSS